MKVLEKYIPVILGLMAVFLLIYHLQSTQEYLFYHREQQQIFVYDLSMWMDRYLVVGGFSLFCAQLLQQFFCLAWVGSIITAILSVLTGYLLWLVCKRINSSVFLFPLCLLPVLFQINALYDFYYHYQGLVSFFMLALFFAVYAVVSNKKYWLVRVGVGCFMTLVLFFLAGSIACLFAIAVMLYDILTKVPKCYMQGITVVLIVIVGFICVNSGIAQSPRFMFKNDFYYEPILIPADFFMVSWFVLLACLLVFFIFKYLKIKSRVARMGLAVLLFVALCDYTISSSSRNSQRMYAMFELQHYVVTEQWNAILKSKNAYLSNFLMMNYVNLALSHEGKQLSNLFNYPQRGALSIVVSGEYSNVVPELTAILSDIYYQMGNVASAQNKAFDSFVGIRYGNPMMAKMLVKTNLIYGAFPIAEKYISLLEKTWAYRDWAREQRVFLYNDEAINQNAEYAKKRKDLPKTDAFTLFQGPYVDLMNIIDANPKETAARDYAMAFIMLAKDAENILKFTEKYYGTEVMQSVPTLFQEAIAVVKEGDVAYCRQHGVSEETLKRFNDFKLRYQKSVSARRKPTTDLREYTRTYWYYYLFTDVK